MPNYQNGKIYTLRSHSHPEVYVGSTCQKYLSSRIAKHKTSYKRYIDGKRSYVSAFELCKYDDCFIELYEHFPCNSRQELEKREGEIIREIECINKHIAGRTKKQYAQEHKEKVAEYQKQYAKDNKEKLKKYHQKYIKEYASKNRERLNNNQKKYYNSLPTISCACGGKYKKGGEKRHNKTIKHISYIESL